MKKPILAAALLLSLAAGPFASSPALAVSSEAPPPATGTSAAATGASGTTDPATDPAADPAADPATDPAIDPATDPATDPVTDPPAPEPSSDAALPDPPVTEPAPARYVTGGGIGAKWRSLGVRAGCWAPRRRTSSARPGFASRPTPAARSFGRPGRVPTRSCGPPDAPARNGRGRRAGGLRLRHRRRNRSGGTVPAEILHRQVSSGRAPGSWSSPPGRASAAAGQPLGPRPSWDCR